MNATEAARVAGYEAKSEWSLYALASKTIKKVKVRKAIDDLLDSFNMTEVEVLAQLVSIAKDREQHPPSRVRALELVGKARGMWARERAEYAHQGDEIVTDIRRK